ncbi:right-handed parallel beta-helix repeat-containing protein [Candidatus Daviesbacteria bacterium]|nr:right-handed parallel beta-helix repeat-containing protein [Candidatus Daviesbacteria bacterium]
MLRVVASARKLHWFAKLVLVGLILSGLWVGVGYLMPKILPTKNFSNTFRWGLIIRSERWSGDIKVVGDIWALPGTSVTLEPGTRVFVGKSRDRSNMDFLPWHSKSGVNTASEDHGVRVGEPFWDESSKIQIHFARLVAIGTKQQPIVIQSDTLGRGSPYDFNVLSLTKGIIANAKLSNYRRLEVGADVTIRDSMIRDTGECAICIGFDDPTLTGNTFENSLREYIWIEGGSPKISGNTFRASSGLGIVVDPKEISAPRIYQNDFEMNGVAIKFLSGSEEVGGVVSNNLFAGGSEIEIPCDSQIKIILNIIKGRIKLTKSGNCVGSLTLGPNYWELMDVSAILNARVVGKEKNFKVLIPSVLKNPPETTTSASH